MERRLTTIVAADIAGFSRLVAADEEGTLSAQRSHRDALLDPLIEKYSGRVANTAGDSLLIEFPSAVQAVRFAIDTQTGMARRNERIPPDRRIAYRIGINIGDVVPEGDDLLGDGVNVAARLEQLAPAGGVLLSRAVRDQVRDKLNVNLKDLGEVRVKNLSRSIRAFQIENGAEAASPPKSEQISPAILLVAGIALLITASAWWWFQRGNLAQQDVDGYVQNMPDDSSLAVLAFDYIGPGEAEHGYLADGISENITTNLAKLPDLLVIGQDTSSKDSGEGLSSRDIAARYGVRYVLEGSVQKSGEDLRISAKLLDATSGKYLWSETFNRKSGDFFDIQDEITLSVLEQVYRGTVDGGRVTLRETNDLVAFAENAKGRAHRVRFTAEDNKTARKHYQAALERDARYVDALVGMAFTHIMDVRLGFSRDPKESLALAEDHLAMALDIDPGRPATLSNLAVLRVVQKRGEEAQEYAHLALEGGTGDARVIRSAAWVLKYAGAAEESLPYFTRAKRMTPVSLWWLIVDEYGALIDAGEFERANALTDAFLEVLPETYRAEFLTWPAVAAWKSGDTERAQAFISEARRLKPGISIASIHPFDLAYIEQSIPERRYEVLRELGLED
ncbi:adenylate/guanylate cyclase domain-containing protein [Ruegeria sp. HKCCA5426]|uniref:adenylate/guanylate cyclase domain-containing protein n=1 Tax=Ruegeria sp. HKCCA5426 TaxID=2682985 RepID=UPI0014898C93|nr:adenylate/guanylate cyclase domain-containing protein [Ruegeria sp. HKCCA5426]